MLGARGGASGPARRLVGAAMARELRALVVPGPEVLRAQGIDLSGARLLLVASPRHADVLVLIEPLRGELREAATVLYAQMMRPRAILALGGGGGGDLPPVDVTAPPTQAGLLEGALRLRELFSLTAFGADARDFQAAVLGARVEYACPMHPEVVQEEPGTCPKCGMTLASREAQAGGEGDEWHGESTPATHDAETNAEHAHERHDADTNAGHAHEGHDADGHAGHSGMGFMSMVAATQDLPRSRDGLPMDWLEVPFGPCFPGLPGGLRLWLTLDGDGVARARAESLAGTLAVPPAADMEAHAFVDYLGRIDPLAPTAYRLLACRAVELAVGDSPSADILSGRLAAAERERVASHLSWLSQLGRQLGMVWLERRAAELQLAVLRAEVARAPRLGAAVRAVGRRLARTPLLRARLAGIGRMPASDELRGPAARAAGMRVDARSTDPTYAALDFEVRHRQGGDAYQRMRQRLDEIEHSLVLIDAAGLMAGPELADIGTASGTGYAEVETPRGEATLHLTLERGLVKEAHLRTASTPLLKALPLLLPGLELGDALTTALSLDISPWEVRT